MRCRIENITELDGVTTKASHAKRVGRTGNLLDMIVGYPMWIAYNDGHGTLMTSTIEQIGENAKEITIKTHNTIYVLEKI